MRRITHQQDYQPTLLAGLASLPEPVFGGMSAFLEEYLDTPTHKVPFGGREESLVALEAWMASEAHPFALLVAEAGRGKSALLSRWAAEVAGDERARVAFVPVSIRFGTALKSSFLQVLGTRLRALHSCQGQPPKSNEAWQAEIKDLLDQDQKPGEPPLLVVLDGLDEAADWQAEQEPLLPRTPGKGVKVLVSARRLVHRDEAGWRSVLGWEETRTLSIALPSLDHRGVTDVLRQMGDPLDTLGARTDVTRELYRLSEGDPLTLRLYLEALQGEGQQVARLSPETLSRLPAGLSGYFERWWEEQRAQWSDDVEHREPLVQSLLQILACALGPLSHDDLETLLRLQGRETLALGAALESLRRFIIGDGELRGYVFSHPRLGYHFLAGLSQEEQSAWEGCFLAYGQKILTALGEGRLSPQEAPRYVVQHYGAHLERADAPTAHLEALVSPHWQRAWEALEGTLAGFSGDVERALDRAERDGREAKTPGERADAIARQFRSVLVLSSIHSLAARIPTGLILALLEANLWTPAMAFAQTMSDPDGAIVLGSLVPYLPETLLRRALFLVAATAERVSSLFSLSEARSFRELAVRFVQLGYAEELFLLLSRQSQKVRAEILATALPHLPERLRPEALSEAIACVHSLKDDRFCGRVLLQLAPWAELSARQALIEEAIRMLEGSSLGPTGRGQGGWYLLLARAGEPERALDCLRANTEDNLFARAMELARIAPYLGEKTGAAVSDEVFLALEEYARQEKDAISWRRHLLDLHQPAALSLERGRAFFQKHLLPHEQTFLLARLALRHDARLLPEALRAVDALSPPYRLSGRLYLAKALPREEQVSSARELLAAIEALPKDQVPGEWKDAASLWLVGYAPLQELRIQAARFLPEEERRQLLLTILEETRVLQDYDVQAYGLARIAGLLPEKKRTEVVEWTRQATALSRGAARGRALSLLAMLLPREASAAAAEEALTAIQSVHVERAHRPLAHPTVEWTGVLLPLLPETRRQEAVRWLLTCMEAGLAGAFYDHNPPGPDLFQSTRPYLSLEQIAQVWDRAQRFPRPELRAVMCLALFERLSLEERVVWWKPFLETFPGVPRKHERRFFSQHLFLIALEMPPEPLHEALESLPHDASRELRAVLQAAFSIQSAAPETLEAARRRVRILANPALRAIALAAALPHLPREERAPAWEEIKAPIPRAIQEHSPYPVFRLLARYLVPLGYSSRLIALARSLPEPPNAPWQALLEILSQLPEGTRAEALEEALAWREREGRRPFYLRALHPYVQEIEEARLHPYLCAVLRKRSTQRREDLLLDRDLEDDSYFYLPFLARFGGEDALRQAAQAIVEVAAWFP